VASVITVVAFTGADVDAIARRTGQPPGRRLGVTTAAVVLGLGGGGAVAWATAAAAPVVGQIAALAYVAAMVALYRAAGATWGEGARILVVLLAGAGLFVVELFVNLFVGWGLAEDSGRSGSTDAIGAQLAVGAVVGLALAAAVVALRRSVGDAWGISGRR